MSRRLMMKNESGGLPSELQEVEWISHAKSVNILIQIPRTDVSFVAVKKVETEVSIPSTTVDNPIVGGGLTSGLECTTPYFDLKGTLGRFSCSPSIADVADKTVKTKYTLTCSGTLNSPAGGHCLWGWDGRSFMTSIRGYTFKMYDADEKLVFDAIPCYRKSDDKIGVYDTISKKFFAAKGTWTKGADV